MYQLPNNFIELLWSTCVFSTPPLTNVFSFVFSSEARLNVSATQQLHRIIMEERNETNELKSRWARLEAIMTSSFNSRWNPKQWSRCLKKKAYIMRNDTKKIRKRF